ncbi:MAG: BatD family protein [bacterium]
MIAKLKIRFADFLIISFILAWSPLIFGQDLEIKAYVNRTTIGLNQQFELSVELSGSDANQAPQPPSPNLEEFAAYLGSSSSQNIQFINGRMSVTKTFTHHFIATKVGKFQIDPIKLDYQGKTFSSAAITIEIVKSQTTPPQKRTPTQNPTVRDTEDLSGLLFLKANVNKRRVYQNEPVIVSYKIYTAVNVSSYGISQLPNTVGFWTEEFPTPQRPTLSDEVINGRRFRVAEIKKVALFPQGPGNKTLDPLIVECEVQVRKRRSRRDIFDSFFDDPFFGLTQTVTRTLNSNPISIEVLPLPQEGKPTDFSGAVGKYLISTTVDKKEVKTNEAVTLRLKISGKGNIKFLPQPKVSFPPDFEVYDPKIIENIQRKENQISGSKSFEYVLIPRFPGNQIIKPISFSYFDLSTKSYKTLLTDPIEISVTKGDEPLVAVGVGTSKEDIKFIGQDIRFIQLRLPEFHQVGSIFYKSWPFYLLLMLPLLILGGGFGYRKHLDKLSTNVAYARSRKANQMALKRLRKAKIQMNKGNLREFYGEVSKALMGFIGDKLNVSAAGLITDQVAEMLRTYHIDKEIVSDYLDCLQTCDYRRFAPTNLDNGEMQEFFEKAKKAIINLEKEI